MNSPSENPVIWIECDRRGAPHAGTRARLVSVLIPSFNHARFLKTCLNAVADEGYPALELVLLDDGSSDDSVAIATDWAQRRGAALAGGWKIGRQENRGVTATLNRLVEQARGEFLVFCASDDALLPGGVATRMDFLERHPDLLAVFGDAALMQMDGTASASSAFDAGGSDRRALRHRQTLGMELICHWVMPGPVLMMRRETISRIGTFDERYAYEDRDYYLRLIAADAVGFLDRQVARYRVPAVKKQARYEALAQDRSRIEYGQVAQMKGLKRIALICAAERHRRPDAPWVRVLKKLQRMLRRWNRRKAHRLETTRSLGR